MWEVWWDIYMQITVVKFTNNRVIHKYIRKKVSRYMVHFQQCHISWKHFISACRLFTMKWMYISPTVWNGDGVCFQSNWEAKKCISQILPTYPTVWLTGFFVVVCLFVCLCVVFFAVIAVPSSCNITLSYNQTSERLLFITSSWNTVPVSHQWATLVQLSQNIL